MEKCSFFNSINGDRRYKAEEWADYFSSFIGNGVFGYASDNLLVSAVSGMTIAISAGKAWINGYFYHNTDALNTALATADGVLNRIDRVVLRWSLAARSIAVAVKQGVAASTPVAPALQRDADVYELALADVLVGKGVLLILQSNITDQRLNSTLCGLVTQTIIAFDTSHYADQINSLLAKTEQRVNADILALSEQLNTQLDENQAAFDAWFARLQATLDGNVAGNLFDMIDAHEQSGGIHVTLAQKNAWDAVAAYTDYVRKTVQQEMQAALVAGGALDESTAQVRNAVILSNAATDFSAVPVGTLIFQYDSEGT
ncbi:MAG TPA: hypothetical protein PKJ47_13415 [Candidatus Limiplasma sp.]|nr:hypothetical protein [Candidatus Limiplasma sp.]